MSLKTLFGMGLGGFSLRSPRANSNLGQSNFGGVGGAKPTHSSTSLQHKAISSHLRESMLDSDSDWRSLEALGTQDQALSPLRENFMQIGLANSEEIRDWAKRAYLLQGKYIEIGEVKKADTINYRTFKPEKDGLFCERIFGPVNDWICGCGNEVGPSPKGPRGASFVSQGGLSNPQQPFARTGFTGPVAYYRGTRESVSNATIPSICPNCQVEFTLSRIRRYRMGYINLACQVTHIWYLNSRPNLFSVLLKMPTKYVKKITYYKGYTPSDPKLWNPCLGPGGDFFDTEWEFIHRWLGGAVGFSPLVRGGGTPSFGIGASFSAPAWLENTGAEALQNYLATRDWEKDVKQLEDELRRTPNLMGETPFSSYSLPSPQTLLPLGSHASLPGQAVPFLLKRRKKRVRTLKLLNIFRAAGGPHCFRSSGLILNKIPVLPPELRPIVQLNAGQLASSDVNDLYRRVISRNNRLKYYLTGGPGGAMPQNPAKIPGAKGPSGGGTPLSPPPPPVDFLVRSERHLVQLACDALLENGKTTNVRHSTSGRSGGAGGASGRTSSMGAPYKSLSDRIGGKQGRFRQNLLGKRVDYSGRSVIVVGPKLKLYECGLPYEMAKELFQAFLIRHIMELQLAKTIRGAKNLIHLNEPLTRQLLENVVLAHPILLNRAPTLHRLGIQAFQPKLINGRGIQLHPLVCPAFNADFDGDQMAVHVPLSPRARIEARLLMLANTNWLSPATGQPSILPSQDMVLGFYYLTIEATSGRRHTVQELSHGSKGGAGSLTPTLSTTDFSHSFINFADVLQAYEKPQSLLNLHSPVWVLVPDQQQGGGLRGGTPLTPPINNAKSPHRTKLCNGAQRISIVEKNTPSGRSQLLLPQVRKTAFGRQAKNPDEPLHLRVSKFGVVRKLYISYKWLEDSNERRRDFSTRTTPGRILVNQILQDFSSGEGISSAGSFSSSKG